VGDTEAAEELESGRSGSARPRVGGAAVLDRSLVDTAFIVSANTRNTNVGVRPVTTSAGIHIPQRNLSMLFIILNA